MSRLIDADLLEPDTEWNEYEDGFMSYSKMQIDNIETVKAIPIKQLEEMYDKFQQKLWREHEDVRGDDMIEVGYAEQFLQELLMEFGCWDKEVEHGTLFDETNGR